MAKFFTIASGSSGNSSFVGASGEGILIDCGISCRGITTALKNRGINPDSLSGILITHEHIDHVRGLLVFLNHHRVPVYASGAVLRFLTANGLVPEGAVLKEIDEHGELVGKMLIKPFKTSHDSVGSLGYSIITPDEHRITVCTDTGYLTDGACEHLTGSEVVLIESNYDNGMLEFGPYPYHLKRRIKGPQGHLSNTDCAAFLPELVKKGTIHIVLGHLSKENNTPDVALQTCISELSMAGLQNGKDYMIFVAPRNELSENILL
ncbi:MAG: MBL fold metallo-hydrolase [Oscillospiraceae bacterium]|nr:MBL fold metallo-hydrolase [Oscillospiraceae bacterium]